MRQIGADGVRSSAREALCGAPGSTTRTVRYADDNERRYKTIQFHPSAVAGTASDLNWGYSNKTLELGMDALPTMEGVRPGLSDPYPCVAGSLRRPPQPSTAQARANG